MAVYAERQVIYWVVTDSIQIQERNEILSKQYMLLKHVFLQGGAVVQLKYRSPQPDYGHQPGRVCYKMALVLLPPLAASALYLVALVVLCCQGPSAVHYVLWMILGSRWDVIDCSASHQGPLRALFALFCWTSLDFRDHVRSRPNTLLAVAC